MTDDRYVPFIIRGLAVEAKSRTPVLLLQDPQGRILLPIWIGAFEAKAIAAHLEGHTFPRPLTHDLMARIVDALGAQVVGLDIRQLDGSTFFANLRLEDADGVSIVVDCRPSDGIALAIRCGAPIRVAAEVLAAAQPIPQETVDEAPHAMVVQADDEEARERLLAAFADMDPGDFGHEM